MEQGFFLAKELNIPWSDIETMSTRDRLWLCERLERWFKEKKEAHELEEKKAGSSGSGRGSGGVSVSSFT